MGNKYSENEPPEDREPSAQIVLTRLLHMKYHNYMY